MSPRGLGGLQGPLRPCCWVLAPQSVAHAVLALEAPQPFSEAWPRARLSSGPACVCLFTQTQGNGGGYPKSDWI